MSNQVYVKRQSKKQTKNCIVKCGDVIFWGTATFLYLRQGGSHAVPRLGGGGGQEREVSHV